MRMEKVKRLAGTSHHFIVSTLFCLSSGVIKDPYKEFLIAEHDSVQKERVTEDFNDQYWETHYTIEQERIPSFLERFAKNILRAGKNLLFRSSMDDETLLVRYLDLGP